MTNLGFLVLLTLTKANKNRKDLDFRVSKFWDLSNQNFGEKFVNFDYFRESSPRASDVGSSVAKKFQQKVAKFKAKFKKTTKLNNSRGQSY